MYFITPSVIFETHLYLLYTLTLGVMKMKYECDKCDYATDNKQSYCAHRSHHKRKVACVASGWNKGLTAETDERVLKNTVAMKKTYQSPKSNSRQVMSWRKKTKQKLVEHIGGCCKVCGYNKSIDALHFHHLDPNTKSFGISDYLKSPSKNKDVYEEVEKCVILCANCHAEYHAGLLESVPV